MSIQVNGHPISETEIEGMMSQIRQRHARAPEQPSEEAVRELAENSLIDHELMKEEAARRNDPISTDDIHRFYLENPRQDFSKLPFEMAKGEVETRIRVGSVVRSVTEKVVEVTAEEAKEFYQNNPNAFARPERVHAAHIVKQVKAGDEDAVKSRMDALKQKLDNGADFEALAKEESDCQDNSSDLGAFPRGQMVQEFEDVVFGMDEGMISDPFKTPFGIHIAKLYKKLPADSIPYDEVKDRLKTELTHRRKHAAIQARIADLRSNATIETQAGESEASTEGKPSEA